MSIIKSNEHVFITGSTGSGKTEIAKVYLSRYLNVYVLDTKGTFDWGNYVSEKECTLITSIKQLPVETPKVIYRPNAKEMYERFYDGFLQLVYLRGDTIAYIDEASQVCQNSYNLPTGYKNILERGREFNVGCWSGTQRPSKIPVSIMTESKHYFVFRLNNDKDRKKLAEWSSQRMFENKLTGHEFYYWRSDIDAPAEKGILKIKKYKEDVTYG